MCFKQPQDLVPFPKRSQSAHKYSVGALGLVVGSKQYTGAAILAIQAAFRAGAGLVLVFSDQAIKESVLRLCPDVIFYALNLDEDQRLTQHSFVQLCEAVDRYKLDLLGIGSGLGKQLDEVMLQGVKKLLAQTKLNVILDADALLPSIGSFLMENKHATRLCVTPHLGEFNRLFQKKIKHEDRLKVLKEGEYGCTILFKGAPSYVYEASDIWRNPTGNEALAVAGTGDVLMGIIAAFSVQGLSLSDGAKWACYVHGLIADLYVKEYAAESFRAIDIIERLAKVLKTLR